MPLLAAAASLAALVLPAAATASNVNFQFGGATSTTTLSGYGTGTLTLHDGASNHAGNRSFCSAEEGPCHSLALDGDNDYTEGRSSGFTSASDGDFSVSVWARSTGWGFSWQPLVFVDDDTYGTYSWAIYGTTNDSGTVHAYIRMRDGATLETLDLYDTPRNTLSNGAWHHVGLIVDGNQASLYFDGALADTQTSSLATGKVNVAADHLFVGGDTYFSSEKFDGFIDDLWLFNEAISAGDMTDLGMTG
ncbi:LamG domain-containing protein [Baekduia sp. Peel2402]|uniref:LamG domain-containing protein n=1 Tax=Baekduia sp. Peel2402 TaxID=3458296 RepID=UPI00403E3F3A